MQPATLPLKHSLESPLHYPVVCEQGVPLLVPQLESHKPVYLGPFQGRPLYTFVGYLESFGMFVV